MISARREHPASARGFGLETPAHDVAEPEDILASEAVVHEQPLLAPHDEARGMENAKMFRHVRRAEARRLAFSQRDHDVQARRFREGAESLRDEIDLLRGEASPGHDAATPVN